jgi:Bacterial Ig domain
MSANASAGAAYDGGVCSMRARFLLAVRVLAASAFSALLTSCGGGVYLGIELGDPGDRDPSVALTAAVSEAPAGATVRLVAAASDDFGVDAVSFYREDAGGSVLLGTDGRTPYEVDTVIPVSGVGTVWRYFARAVDGAGQSADSAPIDITVR